jgi:hypothetical protein
MEADSCHVLDEPSMAELFPLRTDFYSDKSYEADENAIYHMSVQAKWIPKFILSVSRSA